MQLNAENRAATVGTACGGRAVEGVVGEDEVSVRPTPIGTIEAGQRSEHVRAKGQREDRAVVAIACEGRAVESIAAEEPIFSHVILRAQIDVFRGETGLATSSHFILKQPIFTPSGYKIGLQKC